jgi:hypothetical protein
LRFLSSEVEGLRRNARSILLPRLGARLFLTRGVGPVTRARAPAARPDLPTTPPAQLSNSLEQFSRPRDHFPHLTNRFSRPPSRFSLPTGQFPRLLKRFSLPTNEFSRPTYKFYFTLNEFA